MPGLVVKEGPHRGEMLRLPRKRVSMGRAPDNDLQFDDRTVSRYHALISGRDGAWYINDLGSRNRTMVNGECVVAARLCHMDEIHLGSVVLAFFDHEEESTHTKRPARQTLVPEITQTIRLDRLQAFAASQPGRRTELGRRSLRLGHLMALADLGASVKSLEVLLGGVVDSLRQTLAADRVIPILEEPGRVLRPYVASQGGFADGLEGLGIDLGVVERSREQGPVAATGAGGLGPNVACSPIRLGPRNLGLIYCESADPSVQFTDEDLSYLLSICVSAGLAIESIRSSQRMVQRTQNLCRQLEQRYDMVGESMAMRAVYQFIRKVAPTEAGVLICGESGTGKELVARAVHRHSLRCDGPLETVNCAAIPPTLIESELFGHIKGAFTGAVADKPGRFELADGGSLFLDEVVELSPECQTKLLRALEEGKIRRVGDTQDRTVDVRLISATNRDPDEAVAQKRLRPDLFYRIDRLRLVVPPLRDRGGDIEILAHHFLEEFSGQCKQTITGYAPDVMDIFRSYAWPGNVRELQNVVERMVILSDGPVLGAELVPEDLRAVALGGGAGGIVPLSEVEKAHVLRALRDTNGNKKRAAEMLGIDRSTLYAKLRRFGVKHG